MKNEFEQTTQSTPEQIQRMMLNKPDYLPSHSDIKIAFSTQKEWNNYRAKAEFHELLNREFLTALSNYLEKRIIAYSRTEECPVVILEAGAGDGRLTHFLRQNLDERVNEKFKIIAVDIGKRISDSSFAVEKLDYKQALKKLNPTIVICSWMPRSTDWTADFREQQSVKEYLLIGEIDGGACGKDWETWGIQFNADTDGPIEMPDNAPYKIDGFERTDFENISKYQIACSDFPPMDILHSYTVSFRRKN